MKLDEAFGKKVPAPECYYCYDFNDWENFPDEMKEKFDMAVIDPPFITKEVWEKYTKAAKILLKKGSDGKLGGKDGGKLLCSTIDENKDFMKELLDVEPISFRPSIPNLVYQYSFYTNYQDDAQS